MSENPLPYGRSGRPCKLGQYKIRMPTAGGAAFRRARVAQRPKGLVTPQCVRISVVAFVCVSIVTLLGTLYVIVQGHARGLGDGLPGSHSQLSSLEFRRPGGGSRYDPPDSPPAPAPVPAPLPAADAGLSPALRRGAEAAPPLPAPPPVLGPASAVVPVQPQRRRKVLLSEGMGKWNTGVWPNWGAPDVVLNCKCPGAARLVDRSPLILQRHPPPLLQGLRRASESPARAPKPRATSSTATVREGEGGGTRLLPVTPALRSRGGADGRDTADAVVMELVNHPKFGLGKDVAIPW